jgi:hypothetical protein
VLELVLDWVLVLVLKLELGEVVELELVIAQGWS